MNSPLMSEAEVMEFLAVDKKKLNKLIVQRGLRRHELTCNFARVQVEELAKTIEQEILISNESKMGSQEPKVGSQPRFRKTAQVVP